jgi:hypothetical protein
MRRRIRLVFARVVDRRISQLVFEEALQVVPVAARRLLAVGLDALLGVFGVEREVEALDGLAAFVRELGADAAFLFEARYLMASGASVELHQGLALVLELGIIHEVGRRELHVRMPQGDQIAGDIARVFDA